MRNGAWFVRRVWDNGLPLDLALYNRFINFLIHLLPVRVVCSLFRKQVNARFDHALYGLLPNHEIYASSAVVNDDLPCRILSGSVQVRGEIARLTSSGVQFTDGTYVDDIDTIICATGTVQFNVNVITLSHCMKRSSRLLSVCLISKTKRDRFEISSLS